MFFNRLRNFDKISMGLSSRLTDDEAAYLYARVQETRTKIGDLFCASAIVFDAILFSMHTFFSTNSALWYCCRYSYVFAIIWLMSVFHAKTAPAKQIWLALGSSITSGLCGWIIVDLVANPNQSLPIHPSFIMSYVIVVGASVIAMAFVSRTLLVLITSVSLTITWILPSLIEGAPNRYLGCILILFLPLLNHALHFRMIKAEEREMRARLSTMPRRMALSLSDEPLIPKERFSICLSSDWRGYQDLVSGLTDERVVLLLEDYYQRVQELLNKELGGYDFFMDWIADELFAVVYSGNTNELNMRVRQQMALKVIETSQKLLAMKDQFALDYKLDLSIDIGLSSGRSLIGVIGPSNNRKVTALGSNPGRARRMQSSGKLMRHSQGDLDRIIFGDELLIILSAPEEIFLSLNRFDASESRLRNLSDKYLYYVQKKNLLLKSNYQTPLEAMRHGTTTKAAS